MGVALTSDLPGIVGSLRSRPEDFVVEEVLSYEPCGTGTHMFVRIEKRGLTSFEAIRRIARALGRKERDVGYAGLKDKRAITRQTISLEFATEEELRALAVPGVEVLDVVRHKNKLKLGHLRGNRFLVRIEGVRPGDLARAEAKLARLEALGLPNAFGPQRFGRDHTTPDLGRALLAEDAEGFVRCFAGVDADTTPERALAEVERGDAMLRRALDAWCARGRAEDALRALPKRFLSLCVSALQSEVFNAVLDARIQAGSLDAVLPGDVAFLHRNGACFAVDDEAAAAEAESRAAAFEISASGPLPGPSCLVPGGAAGADEAAALERFGVTHEAFGVRKPWAQRGARRALRVPLEDCRITASEDAALLLAFTLPRGSFATALTQELFAGDGGVAPD